MKKTIMFNVQSKGGAGKSMLTYLQALKHEDDPRTYFVDFDSSVMTSKQQLQFLQKRKPPRFAVLNLLDSRNKIDRQLLFGNLQELSKKDFDTFYLDLGAPESDQLPSLFSTDYTIDEFCEIGGMLGCTFTFNVVVAGGGAYQACTSYLSKVANLVDGRFPVIMQVNEGTFTSHPHLIGELERFAGESGNAISGVGYFGDFDANTAPHSNILKIIAQGQGMDAYQFVERIKIKRELAKIK